ncbi:L-ascorbate oxidase-like [Acanthaster planci]|uniref:L-ascorbate oxidase-like n=1 Tax=Acanthaster planci TaxID=133434 RepID=A0A8B7YRD6_ACAPL|nr:L-ascorbate oxidase-like [Acanthaster planci]XP_022095253.1 L-ascorbate oxidase-like [Acanthaster planci]
MVILTLGRIQATFAVVLYLVLLQTLPITALSEEDSNHDCLRSCSWPPKPRICRYEFTVEWSFSMSKACYNCPFNMSDCHRPHCFTLDGVPRAVAVVNRQFPGPHVQVCEHDIVFVKVNNLLINSEGVTIHWHGLHQRGTPYMDGTSSVTQCSIPAGSSFTYEFTADTPGTHWWHSHSGLQRSDGIFGPFIVKQSAPDDPHSGLYDYDFPDHVVFVHDWISDLAVNRYTGHHLSTSSGFPDSVLINGRGQKMEFFDQNTNQTIKTPRETFHVQQGKRYRFRTISNAILDCAIEVSVDNHNLTVITSDGFPFEPVEVSRFVLYGGERFDFILDANQPVGKYWMRVRAVGYCTGANVQALASLIYEGADDEPVTPEDDPPIRKGVILNPVNQEPSETVMNVNQLVALEKKDEAPLENVYRTVYLGLDFEGVNNPIYNHPDYYPSHAVSRRHWTFSSQINHVSFKPPAVPPLTQHSDINEFEMCTLDNTMAMREHCKEEYCECTHVVEVELGKTIELVLVDEGKPFEGTHPMHLHGYSFQVVAMKKLGTKTTVEEVMELDQAGGIVRNFTEAPQKDTVIVPDGGFTAVRFVADNPGWWLFHCHLEFHNTIGMAVMIHVGKDKDLPPKPRDFPRCGNWYPHGSEEPTPTPEPSGAVRRFSRSIIAALLLCFAFLFVKVFFV